MRDPEKLPRTVLATIVEGMDYRDQKTIDPLPELSAEKTRDLRDLIVNYIRRERATQANVGSHFGLMMPVARRLLIELELDGKIEQRGSWWVNL